MIFSLIETIRHSLAILKYLDKLGESDLVRKMKPLHSFGFIDRKQRPNEHYTIITHVSDDVFE